MWELESPISPLCSLRLHFFLLFLPSPQDRTNQAPDSIGL